MKNLIITMLRLSSWTVRGLKTNVRNGLSLRGVATTVSSGTPKGDYYDIKDRVDAYIYFRSLSKNIRPFVYRAKNAEALTVMDKVDADGRPLTPQTYPGIPSKAQFSRFIDGLLVEPELESVKKTISSIDDKAIDFLSPALINSLLYKSTQFGVFGKTLPFVYELKNYRANRVFDSANIEAILLIRAFEAQKKGISDPDWISKKISHVYKHNSKAEDHTLLIDAAKLALLTQVQLNAEAANSSDKVKSILAKRAAATKELVSKHEVQFDPKELEQPLQNYYRREHGYAILKLVQENLNQLGDSSLNAQLDPFLKHVEQLQQTAGVKNGLYQRLSNNSEFPKAAAAPAPEATEEATEPAESA